MTTATYTVIEEDTALPVDAKPHRRLGKGRPRTKTSPVDTSDIDDADLNAEANEMAEMMEQMASEAAKIAVTSAMQEGRKLKDELLKEVEAKAKEISERYVKPQNLCLHVKMGDLKAVKLKTRAATILPDLLVQSKIGQAGGNWPMLFGPTGCGKTVAAEQVATALGLPFGHINCSEGMSETHLTGRQTPNGFSPSELWNMYKTGGVFLFDESDAANDNVWIMLNAALANGHWYNPVCNETAYRHKDFIAIAAANTNGKGGTGAYSGRTKLDGATINRFTMMDIYYDRELEIELCGNKQLREKLWSIREELEKKQSQDVISSRDLKNAELQLQAGFSIPKILGFLKNRMDKSNYNLFDVKA